MTANHEMSRRCGTSISSPARRWRRSNDIPSASAARVSCWSHIRSAPRRMVIPAMSALPLRTTRLHDQVAERGISQRVDVSGLPHLAQHRDSDERRASNSRFPYVLRKMRRKPVVELRAKDAVQRQVGHARKLETPTRADDQGVGDPHEILWHERVALKMERRYGRHPGNRPSPDAAEVATPLRSGAALPPLLPGTRSPPGSRTPGGQAAQPRHPAPGKDCRPRSRSNWKGAGWRAALDETCTDAVSMKKWRSPIRDG